MTDNEIIKALGCISYGGHSCVECKHKVSKGDERCGLKGCNITRNALDLINRQKAEIERLNCQVNRLKRYDEERDVRLHARLTAKARSEAIKEFADRLKKKCNYITWDGISPSMVDDIAKEMTVNYESSKNDKQRKEDEGK